MTVERFLLLVEGPHDLEFCARLIKPEGFGRIDSLAKLESEFSFWRQLVPKKFPKDDNLLARHPVPTFFSNPSGQSVAMIVSGGDSKLAGQLDYSLGNLNQQPDSIGIILDTDQDRTPQSRHDSLLASIRAHASSPTFAGHPGEIAPGPPKTGVYCIPDNLNPGTMEDLLLEGATIAYPQLMNAAKAFTSFASELDELNKSDLSEYKNAGPKKSTASAMASILKPGKSIQVSIQDNRWLADDALNLPRIASLRCFLLKLLQ